MQAFKEDGAVWRICAEQPDRSVAAPPPQRQVFVFGLIVANGDLQDGRRSVGRPHWRHHRPGPLDRDPVAAKVPPLQLALCDAGEIGHRRNLPKRRNDNRFGEAADGRTLRR